MGKSQMDLLLKETGQLTGATWAIWLEHSNDWEELAVYKINLQQRAVLLMFIMRPPVKTWLNGALAGGRSRSCLIPKETGLPGQRLYAYIDQVTQRVILVAADKLSAVAQRFWRAVALGNSGRSSYDSAMASVPLDIDVVPNSLPRALDRILGLIMQTNSCQGGWLAIRSGDYLEIKAHVKCDNCENMRLSIDANPLLREIIQNRKAHIVKKDDSNWKMTPRPGFTSSTQVWAAIPLVIGKRLIALVALWGKTPCTPDEWEKLTQLAKRIAPSVDYSISFASLTNHLQRMALLKDFAVTIFSSQDIEQIVQRTFALLRHVFYTERISLRILFPHGSGIQYYYDRKGLIIYETKSNDLLPSWAGKGKIYRTDLITRGSPFKPVYPGSRSALAIPLKFQKQVIGVLALENKMEGVFTVYDEQLLAVIGSYLSGLMENGRLGQEAEDRERNLNLIHEVVEKVIGQTDVRQVAQFVAELLAQDFEYELAVVALVRGPKKELQLAGIGGSEAGLVQKALNYMNLAREDGIVMRVAGTGESALVNDVSRDQTYLRIPDWDAGSEMCVALKDGDQLFGIIDVENSRKNAFSNNDMLVLESLAGIIASVISNVGQYQKLQMTVKQLSATQTELQEHIAAQRMAERRLVQAAKLAVIGEMAAGIAHELNNPLTTVSGFTELTLEEVPSDSRLHADLELVLREAHRATDVVRRLLDFARQSESTRTRSDINEIVKEVMALVNHLLNTSGVQLITDLPDELPPVSVDRNQVKQVILNLIHNALHAMPNGGELHLSSARRSRDHQDWVTLTVTDTGVGISPENLERIFVPFFTTRAKEGGTGLGLSISYGIIAEHGGFIEAESQFGKGSIFSIWIPVEVD